MNREASEVREVSPGYGLKTDPSTLKVPKEWIRCELSDVLTLQRGYDLPHRHRRAGDYPIISSSGVSGTHQVPKVEGPGVVTGRYGTIGEIFYVSGSYWPLNTTLYVRSFKGNDPKYVSYLLQRVDFISHSGKSGVPGVNRNDVHKEQVNLPPLPEQRAIATALSDVDALLEELDRLIVKKRDLKQATMQQLLTGQTRLPGFEGEWKQKAVNDFGIVITGGTPRTTDHDYWGGVIPWVTPTDISRKRDIYETERMVTTSGLASIRELPSGSVLVTCIASIGKNAVLRAAGSCNQQINAIVPNSGHSPNFLYYLFEYSKSYLLANAGITATNILSKKGFCELQFLIPSADEQAAIATVLSDMDTELDELEQRHLKTTALKQAMMQELLTGRTRLL